jgi:hypothetical protein
MIGEYLCANTSLKGISTWTPAGAADALFTLDTFGASSHSQVPHDIGNLRNTDG